MNSTPLNVPTLIDRLRAAASRARFQLDLYGVVDEVPLLVLRREAVDPHTGLLLGLSAPHVYLSAGIHGDEPAGPLALLRLLHQRAFSPSLNWTILPAMNPSGLARGTRENAAGLDLNRDYHALAAPETRGHCAWLRAHAPASGYLLSLLLHEDWEAQGFYAYELLRAGTPTLAPALLGAAATVIPLDPRPLIDDRRAAHGLIAPITMEGLDPDRAQDLPGAEAIYLYRHHTSRNYTLETPSSATLDDRISAHCAALLAAFAALAPVQP